jgi:hypothetical protein
VRVGFLVCFCRRAQDGRVEHGLDDSPVPRKGGLKVDDSNEWQGVVTFGRETDELGCSQGVLLFYIPQAAGEEG